MTELSWSVQNSLQNDQIDDQHRQIVTILQSLPAQQDDEFDRIFREVLRYTLEHFSAEEAWMRQIDYPLVVEHMRIHQEMAGRFDGYLQQYVDGLLDAAEFKTFLFNWLVEHVLGEDMKIATFLSQEAPPA